MWGGKTFTTVVSKEFVAARERLALSQGATNIGAIIADSLRGI
jgi:hypothetical protein